MEENKVRLLIEDESLNPPFKRAPDRYRVTKLPREQVNRKKEPHCAVDNLEYSLECLRKLANCVPPTSLIHYFLIIISAVSILGHLAFQGYLIYEFKNEEALKPFSVLFTCILLFLIAQGVVVWKLITSDEFSLLRSLTYFKVLIIYLLFFCSVTVYLKKSHARYCVISCILFVCGINVYGIYTLILAIVILFHMFLYLIEALLYCLCFKSSNAEETNDDYNIYYYERNKVSITECVICLEEFKENDIIRVGKCHGTHIFHERCITEWLKSKFICPLCKVPIQFH